MESATQARRPLALEVEGREYVVIASLPKISTHLAQRAVEGGADALLLNIEGDENAPASQYGSYDLHDVYINDVISTVSVPCGIFIGGARPITQEYWERIMSSPFGFVEMYAHQMPAFVLADTRVKRIAAISAGYILEQVKEISQMGGIDAIDVATVAKQGRGTPFSVLDYATLGVISRLSSKAVLLRTQKRLLPSDVSMVMDLGVKGLVLDTSIFSGTDEAYKDEVAGLAPRGSSTEGQ